MLTIGHCVGNERTEWQIEKAKKIIKKYPLLNEIFQDFTNISFSDISNQNTIFRKCIMDTVESNLYLREIEQKILALKENEKILSSQNSTEQNKNFITKLKSNRPSDYLSVIAELQTAFEFLIVFGKNNWSYEAGKKNEKKPDFRVVFGQREVDMELISVMKGDTRTKIETVFDEVCLRYLCRLAKLKTNFTILIGIDTRSLVGDKSGIRERDSINKLVKGLDDLKLKKMINLGIDLNLDFCEIKKIRNNYKFTIKDLGVFLANHYSNRTSDVNALTRHIKKIKYGFIDSPFEFISIKHEATSQCVAIHPIDFHEKEDYKDPKSLATISNDSYIDQIRRAIKKKGKKGQRKKGNPAIILIETFNEHLQHYDDTDFELLPELVKCIQEEIKVFPNVSGVLLYGYVKFDKMERHLFDGIYIKNENASEALSISIEDLQEYNLMRRVDPQLEINDLIIEKNEETEIQREKINKLINIYPKLVNKDDLILMLKSIYSFLLNDNIDNDLLEKLNKIIKECCIHTDPSGTTPFDSSDCTGVMLMKSGVRNCATYCLFRFLKNDKESNLLFISRMSVDENTLVREAVADNLINLYVIDRMESLRIATQLIQDNQRIKCILIKFINHLASQNDQGFFTLAKFMINKYKQESYIRSEIDPMLSNMLRIVVKKGLCDKDQNYLNFIDAKIDNKEIGSLIKTVIALAITYDDLLNDNKLKNKIIEIFTKIYSSSENPEMYPFSQLLNGLCKNKKSFMPEISPFLEKISTIELKGPDYDNFYILDYLRLFWKENPEFLASIMNKFITTNTINNLVYNLNSILQIIADLITDGKLLPVVVQDLKKSIMHLISFDEPFFKRLYEKQLMKIGIINS